MQARRAWGPSPQTAQHGTGHDSTARMQNKPQIVLRVFCQIKESCSSTGSASLGSFTIVQLHMAHHSTGEGGRVSKQPTYHPYSVRMRLLHHSCTTEMKKCRHA